MLQLITELHSLRALLLQLTSAYLPRPSLALMKVASVNPSCDLMLTGTCMHDGYDDDEEPPFSSSI